MIVLDVPYVIKLMVKEIIHTDMFVRRQHLVNAKLKIKDASSKSKPSYFAVV